MEDGNDSIRKRFRDNRNRENYISKGLPLPADHRTLLDNINPDSEKIQRIIIHSKANLLFIDGFKIYDKRLIPNQLPTVYNFSAAIRMSLGF